MRDLDVHFCNLHAHVHHLGRTSTHSMSFFVHMSSSLVGLPRREWLFRPFHGLPNFSVRVLLTGRTSTVRTVQNLTSRSGARDATVFTLLRTEHFRTLCEAHAKAPKRMIDVDLRLPSLATHCLVFTLLSSI